MTGPTTDSPPPSYDRDDLSDWSAYPITLDPDTDVIGIRELALFLGGDATSFTGDLLRLIAKARFTPENLNRLSVGFPRAVAAWMMWSTMSAVMPITAARLAELLTTVHRNLSPDGDASR